MRVLLTGATGFIGRSLAPALVEAGHEVMAGTRRPDSYRGLGTPVKVDLMASDSLIAALDKCEAAYYLVHSMETGVTDFAGHDRRAAETFAAAAADRGIRVVYLGGLAQATGSPSASAHLESRHEVGRILREVADTVELRAAIVVGAGSTSFEILRRLVDRLAVMVCPRWVTTQCWPIALPDVIRCGRRAGNSVRQLRYRGSDVLSDEDMIKRYAALTGRRRFVLKVPVQTPGLSSLWIGLVTDQTPAVARPLAEGLSVESIARDQRIRSLIPFQPMAFDEAVRAAMAVTPRRPTPSGWR